MDKFNEARPSGQVVAAFGTAAIVTPTGRVSVKLILLIGISNGAVTVIVRRLVLPVVAAGTKTLPTSTGSWGAFTTVKSVPVVMADPLPTHPNAAVHAVMALAGIEFSYVVPLPGVELVILKVIVQEEFPTIVPFVRVIELAVFVITPPPH